MKNLNFYQSLRRYLRGSMGEAERERFNKFLDETTLEENDAVGWSETEQAALFNRITKKIHAPIPVKKRISTARFIVVATSITLALLVTYYAVLTFVVKPAGAAVMVEKAILADGTIVWLHAGDRLSYYEAADGRERHALLTGEALFEVAKDPSRPFIIECGLTSVEVLGTSFMLKRMHDTVSLNVLTGKVRMYSADDTTGIQVLPSEHVLYSGKGAITKAAINNTSTVPEFIRATEYDMHFRDATLDQLIDRIEKKFDVTVKTDDIRVRQCHVTADFTDHSLDRTLSMLAEVLDITYAVRGNMVLISGAGCN